MNELKIDGESLKFEISSRCYNGDFGVGSIFKNKYSFEVMKNLCISNSIKKFCNNDELGGNVLASVDVSIPFFLNENEMQKLNNILNDIQSNNKYVYDESHYNKDKFDFNMLNYIDIVINENNYEISLKDEKILNELKDLLKINKIDKILENAIKSIICIDSEHSI